MNMHSVTCLALYSLMLVGCSGVPDAPASATDSPGEPEGSPNPSSPESNPQTGCTCAGTAPVATGPKKTPSPVEVCSGAYKSDGYPVDYFHSDGERCILGSTYVMYPDGRVTREASENTEGTWTGDALYFTLKFGTFTRKYRPHDGCE